VTVVQDSDKKPWRIEVSFNPETPWHLVKAHLEEILKHECLCRTKNRQFPIKRPEWRKLYHYLKIVDLKEQGLIIKDIAVQEFRELYKNNSESAIKQVTRYLAKGRKMINTGKIW